MRRRPKTAVPTLIGAVAATGIALLCILLITRPRSAFMGDDVEFDEVQATSLRTKILEFRGEGGIRMEAPGAHMQIEAVRTRVQGSMSGLSIAARTNARAGAAAEMRLDPSPVCLGSGEAKWIGARMVAPMSAVGTRDRDLIQASVAAEGFTWVRTPAPLHATDGLRASTLILAGFATNVSIPPGHYGVLVGSRRHVVVSPGARIAVAGTEVYVQQVLDESGNVTASASSWHATALGAAAQASADASAIARAHTSRLSVTNATFRAKTDAASTTARADLVRYGASISNTVGEINAVRDNATQALQHIRAAKFNGSTPTWRRRALDEREADLQARERDVEDATRVSGAASPGSFGVLLRCAYGPCAHASSAEVAHKMVVGGEDLSSRAALAADTATRLSEGAKDADETLGASRRARDSDAPVVQASAAVAATQASAFRAQAQGDSLKAGRVAQSSNALATLAQANTQAAWTVATPVTPEEAAVRRARVRMRLQAAAAAVGASNGSLLIEPNVATRSVSVAAGRVVASSAVLALGESGAAPSTLGGAGLADQAQKALRDMKTAAETNVAIHGSGANASAHRASVHEGRASKNAQDARASLRVASAVVGGVGAIPSNATAQTADTDAQAREEADGILLRAHAALAPYVPRAVQALVPLASMCGVGPTAAVELRSRVDSDSTPVVPGTVGELMLRAVQASGVPQGQRLTGGALRSALEDPSNQGTVYYAAAPLTDPGNPTVQWESATWAEVGVDVRATKSGRGSYAQAMQKRRDADEGHHACVQTDAFVFSEGPMAIGVVESGCAVIWVDGAVAGASCSPDEPEAASEARGLPPGAPRGHEFTVAQSSPGWHTLAVLSCAFGEARDTWITLNGAELAQVAVAPSVASMALNRSRALANVTLPGEKCIASSGEARVDEIRALDAREGQSGQTLAAWRAGAALASSTSRRVAELKINSSVSTGASSVASEVRPGGVAHDSVQSSGARADDLLAKAHSPALTLSSDSIARVSGLRDKINAADAAWVAANNAEEQGAMQWANRSSAASAQALYLKRHTASLATGAAAWGVSTATSRVCAGPAGGPGEACMRASGSLTAVKHSGHTLNAKSATATTGSASASKLVVGGTSWDGGSASSPTSVKIDAGDMRAPETQAGTISVAEHTSACAGGLCLGRGQGGLLVLNGTLRASVLRSGSPTQLHASQVSAAKSAATGTGALARDEASCFWIVASAFADALLPANYLAVEVRTWGAVEGGELKANSSDPFVRVCAFKPSSSGLGTSTGWETPYRDTNCPGCFFDDGAAGCKRMCDGGLCDSNTYTCQDSAKCGGEVSPFVAGTTCECPGTVAACEPIPVARGGGCRACPSSGVYVCTAGQCHLPCYDHGSLVGGRCACDAGYGGDNCTIECWRLHGQESQAAFMGTCSDSGDSTCYSDDTRGHWQGNGCDQCQDGYAKDSGCKLSRDNFCNGRGMPKSDGRGGFACTCDARFAGNNCERCAKSPSGVLVVGKTCDSLCRAGDAVVTKASVGSPPSIEETTCACWSNASHGFWKTSPTSSPPVGTGIKWDSRQVPNGFIGYHTEWYPAPSWPWQWDGMKTLCGMCQDGWHMHDGSTRLNETGGGGSASFDYLVLMGTSVHQLPDGQQCMWYCDDAFTCHGHGTCTSAEYSPDTQTSDPRRNKRYSCACNHPYQPGPARDCATCADGLLPPVEKDAQGAIVNAEGACSFAGTCVHGEVVAPASGSGPDVCQCTTRAGDLTLYLDSTSSTTCATCLVGSYSPEGGPPCARVCFTQADVEAGNVTQLIDARQAHGESTVPTCTGEARRHSGNVDRWCTPEGYCSCANGAIDPPGCATCAHGEAFNTRIEDDPNRMCVNVQQWGDDYRQYVQLATYVDSSKNALWHRQWNYCLLELDAERGDDVNVAYFDFEQEDVASSAQAHTVTTPFVDWKASRPVRGVPSWPPRPKASSRAYLMYGMATVHDFEGSEPWLQQARSSRVITQLPPGVTYHVYTRVPSAAVESVRDVVGSCFSGARVTGALAEAVKDAMRRWYGIRGRDYSASWLANEAALAIQIEQLNRTAAWLPDEIARQRAVAAVNSVADASGACPDSHPVRVFSGMCTAETEACAEGWVKRPGGMCVPFSVYYDETAEAAAFAQKDPWRTPVGARFAVASYPAPLNSHPNRTYWVLDATTETASPGWTLDSRAATFCHAVGGASSDPAMSMSQTAEHTLRQMGGSDSTGLLLLYDALCPDAASQPSCGSTMNSSLPSPVLGSDAAIEWAFNMSSYGVNLAQPPVVCPPELVAAVGTVRVAEGSNAFASDVALTQARFQGSSITDALVQAVNASKSTPGADASFSGFLPDPDAFMALGAPASTSAAAFIATPADVPPLRSYAVLGSIVPNRGKAWSMWFWCSSPPDSPRALPPIRDQERLPPGRMVGVGAMAGDLGLRMPEGTYVRIEGFFWTAEDRPTSEVEVSVPGATWCGAVVDGTHVTGPQPVGPAARSVHTFSLRAGWHTVVVAFVTGGDPVSASDRATAALRMPDSFGVGDLDLLDATVLHAISPVNTASRTNATLQWMAGRAARTPEEAGFHAMQTRDLPVFEGEAALRTALAQQGTCYVTKARFPQATSSPSAFLAQDSDPWASGALSPGSETNLGRVQCMDAASSIVNQLWTVVEMDALFYVDTDMYAVITTMQAYADDGMIVWVDGVEFVRTGYTRGQFRTIPSPMGVERGFHALRVFCWNVEGAGRCTFKFGGDTLIDTSGEEAARITSPQSQYRQGGVLADATPSTARAAGLCLAYEDYHVTEATAQSMANENGAATLYVGMFTPSGSPATLYNADWLYSGGEGIGAYGKAFEPTVLSASGPASVNASDVRGAMADALNITCSVWIVADSLLFVPGGPDGAGDGMRDVHVQLSPPQASDPGSGVYAIIDGNHAIYSKKVLENNAQPWCRAASGAASTVELSTGYPASQGDAETTIRLQPGVYHTLSMRWRPNAAWGLLSTGDALPVPHLTIDGADALSLCVAAHPTTPAHVVNVAGAALQGTLEHNGLWASVPDPSVQASSEAVLNAAFSGVGRASAMFTTIPDDGGSFDRFDYSPLVPSAGGRNATQFDAIDPASTSTFGLSPTLKFWGAFVATEAFFAVTDENGRLLSPPGAAGSSNIDTPAASISGCDNDVLAVNGRPVARSKGGQDDPSASIDAHGLNSMSLQQYTRFGCDGTSVKFARSASREEEELSSGGLVLFDVGAGLRDEADASNKRWTCQSTHAAAPKAATGVPYQPVFMAAQTPETLGDARFVASAPPQEQPNGAIDGSAVTARALQQRMGNVVWSTRSINYASVASANPKWRTWETLGPTVLTDEDGDVQVGPLVVLGSDAVDGEISNGVKSLEVGLVQWEGMFYFTEYGDPLETPDPEFQVRTGGRLRTDLGVTVNTKYAFTLLIDGTETLHYDGGYQKRSYAWISLTGRGMHTAVMRTLATQDQPNPGTAFPTVEFSIPTSNFTSLPPRTHVSYPLPPAGHRLTASQAPSTPAEAGFTITPSAGGPLGFQRPEMLRWVLPMEGHARHIQSIGADETGFYPWMQPNSKAGLDNIPSYYAGNGLNAVTVTGSDLGALVATAKEDETTYQFEGFIAATDMSLGDLATPDAEAVTMTVCLRCSSGCGAWIDGERISIASVGNRHVCASGTASGNRLHTFVLIAIGGDNQVDVTGFTRMFAFEGPQQRLQGISGGSFVGSGAWAYHAARVVSSQTASTPAEAYIMLGHPPRSGSYNSDEFRRRLAIAYDPWDSWVGYTAVVRLADGTSHPSASDLAFSRLVDIPGAGEVASGKWSEVATSAGTYVLHVETWIYAMAEDSFVGGMTVQGACDDATCKMLTVTANPRDYGSSRPSPSVLAYRQTVVTVGARFNAIVMRCVVTIAHGGQDHGCSITRANPRPAGEPYISQGSIAPPLGSLSTQTPDTAEEAAMTLCDDTSSEAEEATDFTANPSSVLAGASLAQLTEIALVTDEWRTNLYSASRSENGGRLLGAKVLPLEASGSQPSLDEWIKELVRAHSAGCATEYHDAIFLFIQLEAFVRIDGDTTHLEMVPGDSTKTRVWFDGVGYSPVWQTNARVDNVDTDGLHTFVARFGVNACDWSDSFTPPSVHLRADPGTSISVFAPPLSADAKAQVAQSSAAASSSTSSARYAAALDPSEAQCQGTAGPSVDGLYIPGGATPPSECGAGCSCCVFQS